ncbi:synapse-associated protein of 47 kDa [Plutella xylostella]|uniref:synapse-associated protein of 47 kDa n=1 Tax=Plutella xylostella TaxID=51655 RepID=UPI0020331019|nr:synapse-associated protein of 47 kDa [Plutella xylostella]
MWKITIVLFALAFCVYAEEAVAAAAAAVDGPADAEVAPGLDDTGAKPNDEPTGTSDATVETSSTVPENPDDNETDNLEDANTTEPSEVSESTGSSVASTVASSVATEDPSAPADATASGDSGNKENGTDSKRDSENKFPFNLLNLPSMPSMPTMPLMPTMPPMPSVADIIASMPTIKPLTPEDIANMTPGPDGQVYGASSSISKNVVMENGKEVVHDVTGSTTINNNGNVTTTTF